MPCVFSYGIGQRLIFVKAYKAKHFGFLFKCTPRTTNIQIFGKFNPKKIVERNLSQYGDLN